MGMQQRVWSTFARLDFILVPLPAARITAKIGELSDIYPHHSYRSRPRRLGRQDSNLRSRDQNPVPCLLATPQYRPEEIIREDRITCPQLVALFADLDDVPALDYVGPLFLLVVQM